MKKLSLTILFLLITSLAFAQIPQHPVYNISDIDGNAINPKMAGAGVLFSSSPTIYSGQRLPFASYGGVAQVIISVPAGTAYIGDSGVMIASGFAIASTQPTIVLDIKNTSQLYWTGPRTQQINYLIIQ